MLIDQYKYKAKIVRVVDGDTVDCCVALGFDTSMNIRFRLFGINAPELHGSSSEAGKSSKTRLAELLPVGGDFIVVTLKDKKEKYGRYLAKFYAISEKNDVQFSMNEMLVLEGHAVPFMES